MLNFEENINVPSFENREESLSVLQDMDTDNELLPESILDAIISGKIPHVNYTG